VASGNETARRDGVARGGDARARPTKARKTVINFILEDGYVDDLKVE
jgi:hypothetical protein